MTAHPIPDTFWTTQQELALFGGSALLGIPAGILFDLFRLLRRCIRHPVLAAAAEDVLWMLGVTVMLLCYASACARGVFRLYYAVGCLLGMIVYELTLGEPTVRLLDGIRRLLCLPLRWIRAGLLNICTKTKVNLVHSIQKCDVRQENEKKRLQADGKKVYNNRSSHQQKGNVHGKKQTFGRSSPSRSQTAPARGSGAVHCRLYRRIHQHTEFDHREKKRAGGTGGKH